PGNGAAQYYAGLLFAQSGRPDRAFPVWRRLLETSPPDAPWLPVIRDEIAALAAAAGVPYTPPAVRGPDADDIAAADEMSADERQAMIRGMVDGLADRLATDGGPPEDWARLISALGVLGETARARAIADEALAVFADNAAALATIEAAAQRLPE
ncbi:MAG: c-type cytochrome biogenesis protein CcmI, partial [Silicimonas sp.]|nr:c-type cytochrome biogenesis protein CcmI [Silicimonas sp.]